MDAAYDEAWADSTVEQLARKGIKFGNGLDEEQIRRIGEVFGAPFPGELALFLRAGVPTSPDWARWADGAQSVFRRTRDWVDRGFAFDIKHGQYWHPLFGRRPTDTDKAIGQALAVVRAAPPLIPVFGHRFMTTHEGAEPRAVLSVWQAVDSIFCGYDLADYFAREFHIGRPDWAQSHAPSVPVWEDLFDLFCTGESDEPGPSTTG